MSDRSKIRSDIANIIAGALESKGLRAHLMDSRDNEHTGPMGGVQSRVACVTRGGDSVLITVYSDDRTDEVVDELVSEVSRKKYRVRAWEEATE